MKEILLKCDETEIKIKSGKDLTLSDEYSSLIGVREIEKEDAYYYLMKSTPVNAFVLRHLLRGENIRFGKNSAETLTSLADKIMIPMAFLSKDRKNVDIKIPYINYYHEIIKKVHAYPLAAGNYRIPITRLQDFELLNKNSKSKFPRIRIDKEALRINREPIENFDGSIESLRSIPIEELNIINTNRQTVNSLRKSKKSLGEKIREFGIESLHDLIYWTPRRYIDKTEPQLFNELIEGESATIIGRIKEVSEFATGINFTIKLEDGSSIKTVFFRQQWLRNRFKVGEEVLITGKFKWWGRQPQLNGTSIEHAEQASLLPIVPIYNQSESKGITTNLILTAQRELFSRMNELELPEYLKKLENSELSYYELLKELHFPSSIENYKAAVEMLAFYELVYTQLIIQSEKEGENKEGIPLKGELHNYQETVIKSLPFELTDSQKKVVDRLNEKLSLEKPSDNLLSADVGSGKTIVSQLACLRAVDSGKQAVLVGPTDVLATQLYNTFVKAVEPINKDEEKIKIRYMGSKRIPAKEKRELLKEIEAGEIDIIVGTHSVLSDTVKYNDLGFIAIDELQKFGVEQRERLLHSRADGKVPHILLQSATPIPRSTAQIYYGDVDVLLLKDKPAGRLPIETVWVEDDPSVIAGHAINEIWSDIYEDAEKGHQTFIIAPLVRESENIDAASVEKIYKDVSEKSLSGLNIAYVHGKMKIDEQREIMDKFRSGEYQVLVASTVVEVGVDIPNATRMVIMSADRLGASSLHQIRGRIGRNELQSKCYLVSLGKTDNSRLRLQSLVDNQDGFEVAKEDLLLRGQGTMFSTIQSGKSELLFATLSKHGKYLKEAKKDALKILKSSDREEAISDARNKFDITIEE